MKLLKHRITSILSIALVGMLLFAGIASAHVTVKPGTTAPGAWETYTIKVPSEKDIPTVKVALKVPNGLEFKQYRPVPGWKVELGKNDAGLITTVTWEAETEANGIQEGQFQEFEFVGKNPAEEGSVAWDAYQYYNDGSIVEWTGDENAENPHAITQVIAQAGAEASNGHSHDSGSTHNDHGAKSNENTKKPSAESSAGGPLTYILSAVSLIIALIALWVALQKKK